MKTLAIDFGERRIGLAISDPAGRLALPMGTLERTTDRRAVAEIRDIVRHDGVEALVIGEPRRLDGSRGDAAERIRRFAAKLEAATGLACDLVEETLTTREAARRLATGQAGRGAAASLDAVAAQILLEEALARRTGGKPD